MPPFAYVRPGSLDGVLAALAEGDAKVLAGGQSLAPVLAMRLGRPATLVDIGAAGLDGLGLLAGPGGGVLRVEAAVRQRTVERSPLAAAAPLLGRALPFVGHRELRSRGTVCGSMAHADPAAELPAVAACLDAVCEIAGPRGRRRVPATEFVLGALTTAVDPDEVLVAVEFPVAAPGEGFGFAEAARRHGDFALAGVATRVRRTVGGGVAEARLVAFGVSDRPVVRDVTALVRDAVTSSADGDPAGWERALREGTTVLAAELLDTAGDQHGSPGYRRRLLAVLAARELARAAAPAPRTLGPERGYQAPDSDVLVPGCGRRGRVEAHERAEVELTVNGHAATLDVTPRVHLADALRDRLGLTGTHLGCEHGVCGMCTVLVDGAATRACLLLAVQCDGADVVTVEGLGGAEQHPLQRAFAHHHALQCGFCTPGMLLSAYDLLADEPRVAAADLPERMSGVLCRCTGYRNILAAVADVAATHPDGIPAPLGGTGGPPPARRGLAGPPPGGTAATGSGPARPAATGPEPGPRGADGPTGPPTVTARIPSDPTADPRACGGARPDATAELRLGGRLAQFGRALAGDVSRRLHERFAAAVDAAAAVAPERVRAGRVRRAVSALRTAVRRSRARSRTRRR